MYNPITSKWKIEPDICKNGFQFTDGCGRMSTNFARKFTNDKIRPRYHHQKYQMPSVIQIRIMGFKV